MPTNDSFVAKTVKFPLAAVHACNLMALNLLIHILVIQQPLARSFFLAQSHRHAP